MKYKIVRAYGVEAGSRREAVDMVQETGYDVTYLEWQAIQEEKPVREPNDPFELTGEDAWEDPLSAA